MIYHFYDMRGFKDSKYNVGHLSLKASFEPFKDFKPFDPYNWKAFSLLFQDRAILTNDDNLLYVVIWNNPAEPSYRIARIDDIHQTLQISKAIKGCCEKIELVDGKILATSFRFVSVHADNLVQEVVEEFPYTGKELAEQGRALP